MADVQVVMQALLDARNGVATVMDVLATHDVADLDADPAAFGHDALGAVTADFCDRWAYGIHNLIADGNALAVGLGETVHDYAETERLTLSDFRGGG